MEKANIQHRLPSCHHHHDHQQEVEKLLVFSAHTTRHVCCSSPNKLSTSCIIYINSIIIYICEEDKYHCKLSSALFQRRMSENPTAETKKDWSHLYTREHVLASPLVLEATIVHGFKRGSKELGIPTANLNMDELGSLGDGLETGIYYGHAVLLGESYIAVVSVGWNPYYKNEKKTIEAHLLSKLDDFYGDKLVLTLEGFLRSEANFESLGMRFFFAILLRNIFLIILQIYR